MGRAKSKVNFIVEATIKKNYLKKIQRPERFNDRIFRLRCATWLFGIKKNFPPPEFSEIPALDFSGPIRPMGRYPFIPPNMSRYSVNSSNTLIKSETR